MNCADCGKSINEGPLHRVNPKGVRGVFCCHSCCALRGVEIDADTLDLVNLIHTGGQE